MNRFDNFTYEEIKELLLALQADNSCYKHYKLIKELNEKADSLNKGSLRTYIKSKQSGAFHEFIFDIGVPVKVIDVETFNRYYRSELLDMYEVIEDREEHLGDYICGQTNHYLTIRKKSAVPSEKTAFN